MVVAAGACRAEDSPRLVVVLSIDTLRADYLGVYGHPDQTSPGIDALARRSVVFTRAFSQAPWTTPSHLALLGGLYPVRFYRGVQDDDALPMLWESLYTLASEATLPGELKRHGFATAAFTGGGALSADFGFGRDFERYEEYGYAPGTAMRVVEDGVTWALERGGDLFLFLHTYEPHAPYLHETLADPRPEGWDPDADIADLYDARVARGRREEFTEAEIAYVRSLYAGGVRSADRAVAALVDRLEAAGRLDDTLLIVTSDHGEELWDHSPGMSTSHSYAMCDAVLQVPLLVKLPGVAGRATGARGQLVGLMDVFPTVLDVLGLPPIDGLDGRSLVPVLENSTGTHRDAIFAHGSSRQESYYPERAAIRTDRYKYVAVLDPDFTGKPGDLFWKHEELYDVLEDPRELNDLTTTHPEVREALRARLLAHIASTRTDESLPTDTVEISAETLDRLRALGYIR